MADGDAPVKTSDLGKRVASAIVMVAVAGGALWLGGRTWTAFVILVGLGVLWEWRSLAARYAPLGPERGLWNTAGIFYVGFACFTLVALRRVDMATALGPIAIVVATDIAAYFTGRNLGGPKMLPAISPSKTWSGLAGGMVAAALVCALPPHVMAALGQGGGASAPGLGETLLNGLLGAVLAIVAQAGDFFQSWMKRRAGVKDSGALIPGHGGLFDRTDGLLAVCFVYGLLSLPILFAPA
jgi:phosphatidate cytidylyltransferase